MKNMFSRGNTKLPRNIAIFNIPEVKTCPGRTKACTNLCYAIKASRQYPRTLFQRKRNLRVSISDQFVNRAIQELRKMKTVDTVRIHEAGDFYNQNYLDKWIVIAKTIPELIFFAYTKSYSLDYNNLSKNFIVFYSSDWTTEHYSIQLRNQAIMIQTRKKDHIQVYTKFNKKKVFQCPGSCKTCDYCYTKPELSKLVSFPLH